MWSVPSIDFDGVGVTALTRSHQRIIHLINHTPSIQIQRDMLAVLLLAFNTRKKPNESSSEGRIDEASIKKETKEARKTRNSRWRSHLAYESGKPYET